MTNLETGEITSWPAGTVADIHYKVCDSGGYALLDADLVEITSKSGYVPDMLAPEGRGFGDYVILSVDGSGRIAGWKADLSSFAG